jgi:hypothetical protein
MTIRHSAEWDFNRIMEIYCLARRFMAEHGNPNQWGKNNPPTDQLLQDIQLGDLYVISDDSEIHGVFYFYIGEDPTYTQIDGSWRSNKLYGTIHRIAGDGSGGILKSAVEFAGAKIDHIRIDTHEDNRIMQSAVEKQGFYRCGIIRIADGSPRIAYDRLEE